MFTASEISVQGSVAAGFEKVTNNLNLHQTFASKCIIHVYNVHMELHKKLDLASSCNAGRPGVPQLFR